MNKLLNDILPMVLIMALALILMPLMKAEAQVLEYSFSADTLVLTEEGEVPVSLITPGTRLLAYYPDSNSWMTETVLVNTETLYRGSMVEIATADHRFKVSSEHLFLVLEGSSLSSRTLMDDEIPPEMPRPAQGQWVQAKNLKKGDRLPSRNGSVILQNVRILPTGEIPVYSLKLESAVMFGLTSEGIAAADRSIILYSEIPDYDDSSSRGGCFPEGTLVSGESAYIPIEDIQPGDRVKTLSDNGNWVNKKIERVYVKPYQGQMVRLKIQSSDIVATANHPVLVMEGQDLEERKHPRDLNGISVDYTTGRWVEAGDLREGDRVQTQSGIQRVEKVEVYNDTLNVYNIQVEEHHNYLVGSAGLVVHNKGSAEGEMSAPRKEEKLYFSEDYEGESAIEPEILEDSESYSEPMVDERSEGGDIPQESGLRAGYADDNRQFNYFLNFLQEYSRVNHFPLDISERIILELNDAEGKSIPNGEISIYHEEELLARGLTHSDGKFYFFPSEYDSSFRQFRYVATFPEGEVDGTFRRTDQRLIPIQWEQSRSNAEIPPLDILFILDTTGSMGEEIQRLKDTIELIKLNLSSIRGLPMVRFGLVLYKDRGDEYITRSTLMTEDLQSFQKDLDQVYASGGGDGPEDLQAALDSSLKRMNWGVKSIRLAFVITDAPPHLDYQNSAAYTDSARLAREKGVKIYTVGTGGLAIDGEYILRQVSQYTGARYIFLTYGESGESAGGREGAVSHHTGENYTTDKLESIIIQFAREEMSHVVPISMDLEPEYFSAQQVPGESSEDILRSLFIQACQQLVDYSSIHLEAGTATALTPFSLHEGVDLSLVEFISSQLQFVLSQEKNLKELFRLVERKDLQIIMEEMKLSLSGLIDEDSSARIGEFLGAQLIINGEVYQKEQEMQIFLKLIRVETAEVLSVTKLIIPESLY